MSQQDSGSWNSDEVFDLAWLDDVSAAETSLEPKPLGQEIRVAAPVDSLEAARDYTRRGWCVVPVPRGKKAPELKNWQNLRLTEEDLPSRISEHTNLGLLLGEPSGGLTDVDLDAPEAIAVADFFLPRTYRVHGRRSKPRSHRWYRVSPSPEYVKLVDPMRQKSDPKNSTIVELRQDGHQTIVPPSLHESGEVWGWDADGEPADADATDLFQRVHSLAAAALLARHWPSKGRRHDAALALSGMLLRAGWDGEKASHFVGAVAAAAGDEEQRMRMRDVLSTAERQNAGRTTTGAPVLSEIVGDAVVQRVREWLGITSHVEIAGSRSVEAREWPQALALEAFYGLAGEFVHAVDPYTEADLAAILLQFLTAFGSVVGSGPRFMVGATAHCLNEFVLIVGRTAKSRKGTSLGEVLAGVGAADGGWAVSRVLPGLSSGEGVISHVRDERWGRNRKGEQELVDEGVADKRLLIVEAEFASALRVMQRDGNTLSPVLRCAWDGLPLGTLTKNLPMKAAQSHISIIGHTTCEDLARYLSATDQANGFANRFLVGCARRSKQLPDGGTLPEVERGELIKKIGAAVNFARSVGEMRRSPEAHEIWRAVYPELSRDDEPGLFGALIARAEAHVLRLAMMYALLGESAEILPVHLQAALAVWEFSENSVRYLFGDALGDPIADAVLQALRQNPSGLTRTEISNLLGRHRKAEEISRALDLLYRLKRAEWKNEQTDGRSVERWFACAGSAK